MSKKILICDDDLEIVKILSLRLRSNGYEVVFALDGIQSISLAHKERPDLIILDILMPAGGGQSVCDKLQISSDTFAIPIILFSALSHEEVKLKAAQLKIADFMTKPFDLDELL